MKSRGNDDQPDFGVVPYSQRVRQIVNAFWIGGKFSRKIIQTKVQSTGWLMAYAASTSSSVRFLIGASCLKFNDNGHLSIDSKRCVLNSCFFCSRKWYVPGTYLGRGRLLLAKGIIALWLWPHCCVKMRRFKQRLLVGVVWEILQPTMTGDGFIMFWYVLYNP